MKPLWDPKKLDGKSSRELVAAIECFQQMERLPVTGKAEPAGRSISQLKYRLPGQVRTRLAQTGASPAATQFNGRLLGPVNTLFASQNLVDFLKGWESFVPEAAPDPELRSFQGNFFVILVATGLDPGSPTTTLS